MYKEYAQLIVYRGLPKDSILCSLCAITRDLDEKKCESNELIDRIHTQIKSLLDLSTRLGFNSNLWHCYLTWLLLTNENSFTPAKNVRYKTDRSSSWCFMIWLFSDVCSIMILGRWKKP